MIGAVAAVVLTVTAVSGCGREQPLSAQVGTTTVDVVDREALPPVSGRTMDGTSLDVADLRGRVVVLNSWASWCAPCREEIPAFVDLAEAADPAEVAVVGLNVTDQPAAAEAFTEEFGMAYPSVVDAKGDVLRTIPGVPPAALPSTVIIDREGRIAARIIGVTDSAELAGLVADVVAEPVE